MSSTSAAVATAISPLAAPTFNADVDAVTLREAMRGAGTDEDALISVLANRPIHAVRAIKTAYATKFPGRDLAADINNETSFNFKKVLLRLVEDPADRDAQAVHKAIAGLGTDDDVLIEILCTRSSEELTQIKAAYQRLFQKPLEEDVKGDTSGDYRTLLLRVLSTARPETAAVVPAAAEADAKLLQKAGEGRIGTDDRVFIEIFTTRSVAHIRAIDVAYNVITGHGIKVAIEKETSGNFRKALIALATPPAQYIVEQLYSAFKGVGTDDNTVIHLLTSSAALRLMPEIRHLYELKYHRLLVDAIDGETSGDYRKVLRALASRA